MAAIAFDTVVSPPPASAEIAAIAARQRVEKKTFTDGEIIEGFMKTAFGAEYHLAGRVDRIRKYEAPVRVFADGSRADRKLQLAKVVADIAQRVQHLDIAMAETSDGANVTVKLVRDRDLFRTISTFYGSERDTSTVPWTMFNDNVSMGYFDVYDQYIMNVLYDPRIKAGMTVAEVKAVLPEVLADVRAWVRKVNDLAE